MGVTYAGPAEISAAIAPLAAEPARAAVFFDLDGTLAPIVARPEDARVPARTRELVERIGERYALAGVLSGRRAAEARRILGLDGLTYVGNHGYELLRPGTEPAEPAPALVGREGVASRFISGIDRRRLDRVGLRVEDKAAIVALHWRGAENEGAAQSVAGAIADEARAAGLHTHSGRKVLELRPAVEVDKGVGLTTLLAANQTLTGAFYAGDDRTDADAFRALGEMTRCGRLQRAVRVAVASSETPAEVIDGADLSVAGPDGLVAVLEALA
ncbi:MAG: trehalose-phosphatase [Solirubrobacterales bacterium]